MTSRNRRKDEQRERDRNPNSYDKKKKKKERRKDPNEKDTPYAINVFFQFKLSTMEEAESILGRVSHEWTKRGGGFLRKKKIQ